MPRPIPERSKTRQIMAALGNACHICGYDLKPALTLHHIVPVSLGGPDERSNMILFCANCHRLTHHFGTKSYDGKPLPKYVTAALGSDAAKRLEQLSSRLRRARRKVREHDNVVDNAVELVEALNTVVSNGHFDDDLAVVYRQSVVKVLDRMPSNIARACSYRLVRAGKYISINIMNYLVFRAPAYSDLGGKPTYDCFLMYPNRLDSITRIPEADKRVVFRFKHFDCVSLGLTYEELLGLTNRHWRLFAQACEMAMKAQKSRSWSSNIRVPSRSAG